MLSMLNGDERFVEPTPNSLQLLTLAKVKDAVMNQFVCDNMEVSIVGDFSEEDIESCILEYLGTVKETKGLERAKHYHPIIFRQHASDWQHQQMFLKDTDERACAYIAGPAPDRWGLTFDGKNLRDSLCNSATFDEHVNFDRQSGESENAKKGVQGKLRGHPLFFAVTLGLLAEVINSRLFTTVRDSLGLTYHVSFELNLFDWLKLGWYVISRTSTPRKVHKAVDACKSVLRSLHSNQIAPRELD
ncbi:stromal processing peptidase, chloroplastic-like [Primulina eburnea]|uniref:stromal processing peptidase, chloroplastic-like n=1 Tax=Primulina eburnea TaxID=1245227 RepID=UPI003C6CAD91